MNYISFYTNCLFYEKFGFVRFTITLNRPMAHAILTAFLSKSFEDRAGFFLRRFSVTNFR